MNSPIITYHDTANNSAVVIRSDTGAVRPISNPQAWLASWTGPTIAADNIRYVLRDLGYEVKV